MVKVRFNDQPIQIRVQGAALVAHQSALAQAAASLAQDAADFAEGFTGPVYASVGAGEAATTPGQIFRVSNGDGPPETTTAYRRTSGGSVEQSPLATTAALASTDPGKGLSLAKGEGGESGQDVADAAAVMKALASDSDPLIPGTTYADTGAAEAAYPKARVIRSDGPEIFIRPDEPDGAINAERYGVVEGDNAATGESNGAILSWLIGRGYLGIRHRAARLAAHNIEINQRGDLSLFFRTVRNRSTNGSPMFHINKGVTGAAENSSRIKISADVLESYGSAGHMFHIEGLLATSPEFIDNVRRINSRSPTGSIFYFDPDAARPGRSTFVNYRGGEWRAAELATVPMMFQDNDHSSFNNNIVAPGAIYCPANVPAIVLLMRGTGLSQRSNKFNLPLEYCRAGGLILAGHNSPEISAAQFDHNHWGAEYLADMIFVGGYDEVDSRYGGEAWFTPRPYSNPGSSNAPRIRRYSKATAMNAGSFYDIYLGRADSALVECAVETTYAPERAMLAHVRPDNRALFFSNKNLLVTGFNPALHVRFDPVEGFVGPSLSAGGAKIVANTPLPVAAAVVGSSGTFQSNRTGLDKAFSAVSRPSTGVYVLTLGTALLNTAPIVSITGASTGDNVFSYNVDSTTQITVNCRAASSLADRAFSIEVKE